MSLGCSPRRLMELSVWRWLSSTADGALCRWLSANRSDDGIKSRLRWLYQVCLSKGHFTEEYAASQDSANFVDLLHSQQNVVFGSQGRVPLSSTQVPPSGSQGRVPLSSTQVPPFGTQAAELPAERKERRTWIVTEDIVLISSWLNTSKDPVVGNEQKSATFWTRVAAYFSASPKLAGCEKRDGNQCKQRWHKLNEAVCKFSGAYEAATREKTSGMNDNDVLKRAHEIYFNNHQKKFVLEHAWNELRNDQKWCDLATSKTETSSKRRKFADGSHSGACSHVNECNAGGEGTSRPPGVKAAKAGGKKPHVAGEDVCDYQLMWSIKKDDLAMKQQLSKMRVLEKLLAKENLEDYEEDLKKKISLELM